MMTVEMMLVVGYSLFEFIFHVDCTLFQAARRGAKSAMISEHLAGGDCLNVGCVPSKALIRAARAIREVRRASEFGVVLPPGPVTVDFGAIMKRMREKRAAISPADGHEGTTGAGAQVFQGRGRFTGTNTIEVNGVTLKFRKAVIATGGRPAIPNIPGLKEAPYTTNEVLFNLETLPPRMVILGAGVISLEMAQTFQTFGSDVTVVQRSERLFQSKGGDKEAAADATGSLGRRRCKVCNRYYWEGHHTTSTWRGFR